MDRDIQSWLDAVPEDKRSEIDALRELIAGLYPQADAVVSYGILMYRAQPSRGMKAGWVGLGWRKGGARSAGGVSLYTNGRHLAEFKEQHPQLKYGKGTINLKLGEPLPLKDLTQVIRHAMEQQPQ